MQLTITRLMQSFDYEVLGYSNTLIMKKSSFILKYFLYEKIIEVEKGNHLTDLKGKWSHNLSKNTG